MKLTGRLSLALLVLFVMAYSPAVAVEDTRNSTKLKEDIADELVDIADKAADNGLFDTAAQCLDEALGLVPEHRKAAKAKEKLEGSGDSEDAEALETYTDKSERYRKKAALGYCALFLELIDDKDTVTVDAWLERAYQLHTEETDEWVEDEYKTQLGRKNHGHVHRMLSVAAQYQLEDEKQNERRASVLLECVAELSVRQPMMMQCRSHKMKYWLSLPKGWSAEKKWPVYVAVEGAGCNFKGAHNGGRGKANEEFIVVTPIGFTNTNELTEGVRKKYPYDKELIDEAAKNRMGFDEPGMVAILAEIQELYNAQDKACITGFSGGGILTWQMVFKHPDKLLAACPACANFAGASEVSDDAEAKKALIIHAFQGDKDKYKESMLDAQWEAAKKLAEENGYENVKRDIVPGGHIGCHGHAREVFRKACGLAE